MTSATASVLTQPERSASGMARRLAAVSMVLGITALTVIPWPRTSWARAWVRAMIALLATV